MKQQPGSFDSRKLGMTSAAPLQPLCCHSAFPWRQRALPKDSWVQAPQLWVVLQAAARHALGLRAALAADKLSLIPFGVLVKYDRGVGLLRAESSPFGLRFRGKASQLGLRSRVTCQAFCVWGSSQGYPLKGVGGSIQATSLGFVLTASYEGYASVSALWVKGYAVTRN